MSHPVSVEFSTVSTDHQRLALFQTKVQFWVHFVGVWLTLALGLVPTAFLLIVQPEPLTLKITAVCLSVSFQMFSLCFARSLKQTREWLDDHYDRIRRDEHIARAREIVDSIEDQKLRDEKKAEMAQWLFREEAQSDDCIRKLLVRRLLRQSRDSHRELQDRNLP